MFNSEITIVDYNTKKEIGVKIWSCEATEPIILNGLDVEFIEQDHNECGALDGNLDVIVDEGLINISWMI